MKKAILLSAVIGIALLRFPNFADAIHIGDDLRQAYESSGGIECVKAQGWTLEQVHDPKNSNKYPRYKSNPVNYIEEYIAIYQCVTALEPAPRKGESAVSHSRNFGFDLERDCVAAKEKPCLSTSETCVDGCMDQLRITLNSDEHQRCFQHCMDTREACSENARLECLEIYYNDLRNLARKQKGQARDILHEPPPPEEPPVADTPPVDNQDFPPDDPRNMFCQPPPGAVSFFRNEFGIPIANAQIYSSYSVITHVQGEVLVWSRDASGWAPAFQGQRLMIGDKIKTSRNGRAEVKFSNSSIFRMRSLSQLEIPDHKSSCSCHINHRVGYLDMKFGKVWSKVKPADDECDWSVKTPTAIAGGTDRYDPDLPRNYVSYPKSESVGDRLKKVWSDIINNLSGDGASTNSPEYYRQPQSFRTDDMNKIALNVIDIQKALAEDGSITLHVMHDETTNKSSFYVEEGAVAISDIDETASVVLSAGETMSVSLDTVPHDMDVEPASQVAGQWWEEWDAGSGIPPALTFVLLFGGFAASVYGAIRCKKILLKIAILVVGPILTFMLIGFVAMAMGS